MKRCQCKIKVDDEIGFKYHKFLYIINYCIINTMHVINISHDSHTLKFINKNFTAP